MSSEDKIRNTADAIRGLVEAVPVYEDALQPAVREIGSGLQTVAKTIHIALAPISALVWGYEQIKEFVAARVAEKLKDVPPGRIRTPDPHVVGPALEALRYTGHDESLRELYANLLARSLDSDTAQQAHPAFVEMIKNMSPDEARIMRIFAIGSPFPMIAVHLHRPNEPGYQILSRSFSLIGQQAECIFPELTPNYLDNLSRLGLVYSPGAHGLGSPKLVDPKAYEPLEQSDQLKHIRSQAEGSGARIEFALTFIEITDLGKQFCLACVVEKSETPGVKQTTGQND